MTREDFIARFGPADPLARHAFEDALKELFEEVDNRIDNMQINAEDVAKRLRDLAESLDEGHV